MTIQNQSEYENSKKFLQELLDHENKVLIDLQGKNFDPQQISLILDPLVAFRMGVEDDLREYESQTKA